MDALGLSRYHMPKSKPIREQAAERGEPMPFGATIAELRARGYEVDDGLNDCIVVVEDKASPTGAVWRVRVEDMQRILQEDGKALKGRLILRFDRSSDDAVTESVKLEPEVTAAWLRQRKLPGVHPWLPGWAIVNHFDKTADGLYMAGQTFCPIPAVAPTHEDFDAEDERRGAAGIPPLQSWQRPSTTVKAWVRQAERRQTGEMLAVEVDVPVGDAEVPHNEGEPMPQPEEPNDE